MAGFYVDRYYATDGYFDTIISLQTPLNLTYNITANFLQNDLDLKYDIKNKFDGMETVLFYKLGLETFTTRVIRKNFED